MVSISEVSQATVASFTGNSCKTARALGVPNQAVDYFLGAMNELTDKMPMVRDMLKGKGIEYNSGDPLLGGNAPRAVHSVIQNSEAMSRF